MPAAPLVLALRFDLGSFARLDALRRAHFPPERNQVPAHLTLFHALPGEALEEIATHLREACAALPVQVLKMAGLRFLGRGVALEIEAPGLAQIRAGLARRWADWLTPQDAQRWRPHVTIQNKVAPETARALHDAMTLDFTRWEARGEGLLLWHYRGGPWEAAAEFPFAG
ncbi:2'-5' RNA ligase family protein [Roseomonas xinghualingensis]|uniref:2'-5' RNA ligase family protein n=1 Tax=Roseomonas xinghualingensis TaxID=2986475 RepID=UPI0021F15DE6|nr:2'-5' RNA ligase family protein [Roseomonas sp. SXEYE001]MCV4209058.1 2'-5' RNA ligase family protein [Roseomonas sp. SXEYE001]